VNSARENIDLETQHAPLIVVETSIKTATQYRELMEC